MTRPVLKGMTWSHPRGYDPMLVCSAIWHERTGVQIDWEKRSLQDFESYPVEELARAFDLIVIDHPHVGQITAEQCLAPLDVPGREAERAALSAGSVGQSYTSYLWHGRQWAFPIDAATQVLAWRPDALAAPPSSWRDVLDLADAGRAMLPLRPPHGLMSFFTLCGNLGHACAVDGPGDLVDLRTGTAVFEMLREIAGLVDSACLAMDPIAVFETMAEKGSPVVCAPLIYGYVSYAAQGFRRHRLAFADIPVVGTAGPVGSALGGTGIAVSAFSRSLAEAIDFAYWIADGETQRGPYAAGGGQPGHALAWGDAGVNEPVLAFYERTRATLDGAWVRPRHDGYMTFQQAASARITDGLRNGHQASRVVADLNGLFRESFPATV